MKRIMIRLVSWSFLLLPLTVKASDVAPTTPPIDISKMIHDIAISVFNILLPILAALVAWLVKKIIDSVHSTNLKSYIVTCVKSAEQSLDNAVGTDKFKIVADKIHDKFPYLSEEEIKDLIEEAVNDVNASATKVVNA